MTNEQRHAKEYTFLEIFESYHWLVHHIHPGKRCLMTCIYSSNDLNPKPPECLYTAMEEVGKGYRLEVFAINHPHPDIEFLRFFLVSETGSIFDTLLNWHIDKGISKWVLHTKDGKSITCMADIERLWKERGLFFDNRSPSIDPSTQPKQETTCDHVALSKEIIFDPTIYFPLTNQQKDWLKKVEKFFSISSVFGGPEVEKIKAYLAEEYNTYRGELSPPENGWWKWENVKAKFRKYAWVRDVINWFIWIIGFAKGPFSFFR